MSKNTDSPMVSVRNENCATASLLALHYVDDEKSEKIKYLQIYILGPFSCNKRELFSSLYYLIY